MWDNFNSNYYSLFQVSDKQAYFKLRNSLISIIRDEIFSLTGRKFNDSIHNLHNILPLDLVNSVRYNSYLRFNSTVLHEELFYLYQFFATHYFGQDVAVQKLVNLSIVPPNDSSSIIPFHSDINTGESLYQVVVWIPFTDCIENDSVFIVGYEESMYIHKMLPLYNTPCSPSLLSIQDSLKTKRYVPVMKGELLFFSPILYHGSDVNTTSRTRISINFRIKSLFSPYTHHPCHGKGLNEFFIPIRKSAITRIVDNYIPPVFK